jgi:Tfp pilus assembly protein PilX
MSLPGDKARGVVLITCLIVLTAMALMVISGADRSLVNLKLAGNQTYQAQSFLLAESAVNQGVQNLQLKPELIKAQNTLWEANHPHGRYKSITIPMGADNQCNTGNGDHTPGTRWHAEVIGSGYGNRNATAHHAIGISVCEHAADGSFGVIITRYWRTLDNDELAAMSDT